jgi:hypothetical protein
VRNRLRISNKFFKRYLIVVYISLFGVLLNRLTRREWKKAKNIFCIIIGRDVYPIKELMK